MIRMLFSPLATMVAGVVSSHSPRTEQVAVFSGGCFWGVQAVFQHVVGVTNAVSGYAVSGYAGGDAATAQALFAVGDDVAGVKGGDLDPARVLAE